MRHIPDHPTVRAALARRARADGGRVVLRYAGAAVDFRSLWERVEALAGGLAALGVAPGDRVPVMLDNHPDHVATFFALLRLGAVQVPVNTGLRGAGLEYLLGHSAPRAMIAEARYAEELLAPLGACGAADVIWRGDPPATAGIRSHRLEAVEGAGPPPPDPGTGADDVAAILYTSGTTGPPKGVMVTDRMLRAAGRAASLVAGVEPGDVLFMWEPLYHIGGSQVLVFALEHEVTLHLVERFSASRFWDQVRAAGATRIHYLGGILQMLLRQPPRPDDRDHRARIAWGGGCPTAVWGPFEERFGVQIRENYGMTECSSLTTMNLGGPRGSAGRPCPWFEVEIRDLQGAALATGERGEIVVRGREPGLVMPGYFRSPEATTAALRDGWMHTGDLGWFDADGYLYFGGRLKDSIRRRGENVSAWEIERVVEALEWVEESAAIGVPDELGDEEIKLFVRVADGAAPDPGALLAWCESRLARFQIPRYLAFIEAFEKTGTQRIRKETLPRGTDGCWTREPDGSLRPAGR